MKMKKFLILLVIWMSLMGIKSFGQTMAPDTNSCFRSGENTLELAPTMTSANLFNLHTPHTFGQSFETEHCTSANMGTGLEMGTTALGNGVIIDHLGIMEDFRIVPFPNNILFKKLALGLKTAADTYFATGNKDLAFGGEVYWTFTRRIRLEADVMQHIQVNSGPKNTARIGIQWMF